MAEEIGIPFPKPFRLQMDNDAARCFAEDTVSKSKLKHIDARQEWVKILRDREIYTPVRYNNWYMWIQLTIWQISLPRFCLLKSLSVSVISCFGILPSDMRGRVRKKAISNMCVYSPTLSYLVQ